MNSIDTLESYAPAVTEKSSEVVIKVRSENTLKEGHGRNIPNGMVCLDAFTFVVNGEARRFFYMDDNGKKLHLLIEGNVVLNKNNRFHEHNLKTLKINLIANPDLHKDIEVLDQTEISDAKLKKAHDRTKLQAILLEKENDGQFLAKVYRRVMLNSASGITPSVMLTALIDKSDEDIDAFRAIDKSGKKWVFESEYFETEALLDLALERGIIVTDSDRKVHYQQGTKEVIGKDRATTVFELNTNPTFAHYIKTLLSGSPTGLPPQVDKSFTDSEDLADALALSEGVSTIKTDETGAADMSQLVSDKKTRIADVIKRGIVANLIAEVDKGYIVEGISEPFDTEDQLIGFLQGNEQELLNFEEMLARIDQN